MSAFLNCFPQTEDPDADTAPHGLTIDLQANVQPIEQLLTVVSLNRLHAIVRLSDNTPVEFRNDLSWRHFVHVSSSSIIFLFVYMSISRAITSDFRTIFVAVSCVFCTMALADTIV
jgi:hypothetical protein